MRFPKELERPMASLKFLYGEIIWGWVNFKLMGLRFFLESGTVLGSQELSR